MLHPSPEVNATTVILMTEGHQKQKLWGGLKRHNVTNNFVKLR